MRRSRVSVGMRWMKQISMDKHHNLGGKLPIRDALALIESSSESRAHNFMYFIIGTHWWGSIAHNLLCITHNLSIYSRELKMHLFWTSLIISCFCFLTFLCFYFNHSCFILTIWLLVSISISRDWLAKISCLELGLMPSLVFVHEIWKCTFFEPL
jgi:hypothetical protein